MNRLLTTKVLHARRGIGLLEVVLSIAIFGMAWGALAQMVQNGVRLGLRLEAETQAATLCRSKLEELIASGKFQKSNSNVFPEHPDWQWSANVSFPLDDCPELARIEVTVTPALGNPSEVVFSLQQLAWSPRDEQGKAKP